MEIQKHSGSTLGALLLIAGTCVGGGMLGIPILSGLGGFIPALVLSTIIWICMLSTGFLYLEANLGMPDGANLTSMAGRYLGKWGKVFCAAAFLFIYYSLVIAYYSGGVPIFLDIMEIFTGKTWDPLWGYILFALFFGGIVYLGTHVADRINFLLMIGFFVSFFLLLVFGRSSISTPNLLRHDWTFMFLAAPIFFASFGYQNIIPSMATYLKRDISKLRRALFFGTLIPFVIYVLWQWFTIGSLPGDAIWDAFESGSAITQIFHALASSPWLGHLAYFFSLFAIVTSLIGVSISMVDFLGDSMRISKDERVGLTRLLLCFIVFLPPMVFAYLYPGIFLQALGYAGGFGETILNAIIPIWMVWIARYRLKLSTPKLLPGGKIMLLILLAFSLYTIYLQTLALFR